MITNSVTRTTVSSRCCMARWTSQYATDPGLFGAGVCGVSLSDAVARATIRASPARSVRDRRRRHVGGLRRSAAFEACRVCKVRAHVGRGNEAEARVGVARLHQAGRDLVQEQLNRRDESLQVGLLVDREVEVAALDTLQHRDLHVPALAPDLALQVVLLDRVRHGHRVSVVHGVEELDVLVAGVPGLDGGDLAGLESAAVEAWY